MKVSVRDMELWVPYAVKYHFCDRDCHPHLKCLCMTNTILLYYFWLISCDCSRKLRCRTNKCHLCGAIRMRPIPIFVNKRWCSGEFVEIFPWIMELEQSLFCFPQCKSWSITVTMFMIVFIILSNIHENETWRSSSPVRLSWMQVQFCHSYLGKI